MYKKRYRNRATKVSTLIVSSSDSFFRDIMNNKVFYQHPNLMRALGMHETVMEVMVNVLGGGESKVRILISDKRFCFRI